MMIEGYPCICLGHGYLDPVIKHSYWGTQAVVEDLERMNGFYTGEVVLRTGCVVVDPITNLVKGLRQAEINMRA
jgi:hypothetical protein